MMTLTDRICELIDQHGSLRAVARVLEMDPGYLSRLSSGEKDNPDDVLLRRMGLRRVVRYERAGATASTPPAQEAAEPSDTNSDKERRRIAVTRFALSRFIQEAYARATEAGQDKDGKRFKPGAVAKLLDDARDAQEAIAAIDARAALQASAQKDAP